MILNLKCRKGPEHTHFVKLLSKNAIGDDSILSRNVSGQIIV